MTRREAVIEQLESMGFERLQDESVGGVATWERAFRSGPLQHDLAIIVRVGLRGKLSMWAVDGSWTHVPSTDFIRSVVDAGEHFGRWLV